MALKYVSFLMIFALLAFSSLFGVSTAFGSRKALAPAPAPDTIGSAPDNIGLAPFPGDDIDVTPLNPKDPEMKELAIFAIDEYNKNTNSKLVLSFMLEAISSTNGEETIYALSFGATKGKDLNTYTVSLSVTKDVKTLTSFGMSS